ncbi:hypothetical protein QQF64_017335 [Cirrhinus molitorella]|uniref:Uncharacterized protein n=1 Tax=Cirrhinus molitorella TaxID=172907 RepID=A0ABR3LLZ6_9TELE
MRSRQMKKEMMNRDSWKLVKAQALIQGKEMEMVMKSLAKEILNLLSMKLKKGEGDTEMAEDESIFKTPASKRKLKKKGQGKKARKINREGRKGDKSPVTQMESDMSNADESVLESEGESSGSVS